MCVCVCVWCVCVCVCVCVGCKHTKKRRIKAYLEPDALAAFLPDSIMASNTFLMTESSPQAANSSCPTFFLAKSREYR